jgi:nonribosomal peptide synthetase MxcG
VGEKGITVLDLPTAYWHELVAALDPETVPSLACVRLCIIGGEAARADRLRRWRTLCGRSIVLLNTYGPTEGTVVSTVADLGAEPRERIADPLPIGRPWPGVVVRVCDALGRLLPTGAEGELVIGGPQVAQGYVGDRDLTARRFADDPIHGRLYRTGDRVRWRPDGVLLYLGRADDQVKVRGVRVELGEIEAALRTLPGTEEVAAVAATGSAGTEIIAFVEPRPPHALDGAALREALRALLPDAFVPAFVDVRPRLPRTVTGKIDRRALIESPSTRSLDDATPPRSPRETVVARLFAEVFGLDRVGIHQSFFALGGHSLLAVRLMTRVEEEFGTSLPLRTLFEGPTPARIAAALVGEDEVAAETPDLLAEAWLDPVLRPTHPPASHPTRTVLLTGATGFLGSFILRDLLAHSPLRVALIVRGEDEKDARRRVADALRRHGLDEASWASRTHVLAGDLSKPRFGLHDDAYAALLDETDAIIHGAASTSFLLPYAALRSANVTSTLEVIRFALDGRTRPLHHVSTIGIFDIQDLVDPVTEDADLLRFTNLSSGYAQSKWVAERMVWEAGARGLPITVHRPGRLIPDQDPDAAIAGPASTSDISTRLLELCVTLDVAPDLDLTIDATPVSYVSRGLVELVLDPSSLSHAFHYLNPTPLSLPQLRTALLLLRPSMQVVPWSIWHRKVAEHLGPNDPLLLLLPSDLPPLTDLHPVTAERTRARLARAGIHCLPADPEAIARALLKRAVALQDGG